MVRFRSKKAPLRSYVSKSDLDAAIKRVLAEDKPKIAPEVPKTLPVSVTVVSGTGAGVKVPEPEKPKVPEKPTELPHNLDEFSRSSDAEIVADKLEESKYRDLIVDVKPVKHGLLRKANEITVTDFLGRVHTYHKEKIPHTKRYHWTLFDTEEQA